jgi:hypothetical protein
MSSSNSSTLSVLSESDLTNQNAKNLLNRLKLYCRWKSSLSVCEMRYMTKSEKMALLLKRYGETVDALKSNDSIVIMKCDAPTSRDWDTIRLLLKSSVKSGQAVCICLRM